MISSKKVFVFLVLFISTILGVFSLSSNIVMANPSCSIFTYEIHFNNIPNDYPIQDKILAPMPPHLGFPTTDCEMPEIPDPIKARYIFTHRTIDKEPVFIGDIVFYTTNYTKKEFTGSVVYDSTSPTSGDILAILDVDPEWEATVVNNQGGWNYTFTDNGVFDFELKDPEGESITIRAEVDRIDKIAPTCDIEYTNHTSTVSAKLVNCSESITVINNSGNDEYLFTTNGSFEFEYQDIVGNKGSSVAIVNSIQPLKPSGGGGGSNIKQPDSCTNGDYSSSYYDGECGEAPKEEHGSGESNEEENEQETNPEIDGEKTEEELLYEWAKEYKLTNTTSLEEMRLMDGITRAEMAKLASIYATTFLKKSVDTNKIQCNKYKDLKDVNKEFQEYIIQSCQLGFMGYYSDGKSYKDYFVPNEIITRAEAATTISRMLWGNQNKGTEEWWYHNHLLALEKLGIIQNRREPMNKETRYNVIEMLNILSEKIASLK